jgi:ribulose kinase
MLNQKQRQLLDSGLAQINQYRQSHTINNRQDILRALQHFGVTNDFLSNTGGLAKNPVVQKIASVCGVDIDKVQQDIRSLLGQQVTNCNQPVTNSHVSDSLQQYRDALKKLK